MYAVVIRLMPVGVSIESLLYATVLLRKTSAFINSWAFGSSLEVIARPPPPAQLEVIARPPPRHALVVLRAELEQVRVLTVPQTLAPELPCSVGITIVILF